MEAVGVGLVGGLVPGASRPRVWRAHQIARRVGALCNQESRRPSGRKAAAGGVGRERLPLEVVVAGFLREGEGRIVEGGASGVGAEIRYLRSHLRTAGYNGQQIEELWPDAVASANGKGGFLAWLEEHRYEILSLVLAILSLFNAKQPPAGSHHYE